jgi:hypothetical protein
MGLHETTRSEADLGMKCYTTFLLALKAVGMGIDHQLSSEEYMRIWAVINEVAKGEQTLNASPAEQQASAEMLPAMKQYIQENAQTRMQRERELAALLLKAADGFTVRENGPKQ